MESEKLLNQNTEDKPNKSPLIIICEFVVNLFYILSKSLGIWIMTFGILMKISNNTMLNPEDVNAFIISIISSFFISFGVFIFAIIKMPPFNKIKTIKKVKISVTILLINILIYGKFVLAVILIP